MPEYKKGTVFNCVHCNAMLFSFSQPLCGVCEAKGLTVEEVAHPDPAEGDDPAIITE